MSARLPSLARLARPSHARDPDLLARFAQHHDEAAFAELVARHGPLVLGVCRRVVADRHLAEDCFQAVFLVLARKAGAVTVGPSLANWLFGTARRVALAARRREARHADRVEAAAANPTPDAPPDWDDLLRVLDDELERLPPRYRAPLVECFLRERTQDEAAAALGWSLSTLRRRLARGKEILRARLTGRGATLAGGLLAGLVAPSAAVAVPRKLLAATAKAGCGLAEPSAAVSTLAASAVAGGFAAKAAASAGVVLLLGGLAAGFLAPADLPGPPVAVAAAAPVPATPNPDLREWVTVRGRVVLPDAATVPEPRPVAGRFVVKDVAHFPDGLVLEDVVVNPKDRGVKNVVVWLRPDSDDGKAAFPADRIRPSRRAPAPAEHVARPAGGQFAPRVVAARAGDVVRFENPTDLPHNVRYEPAAGGDPTRMFNVIVPAHGGEYTADRPLPPLRGPDRFASEIYPWMCGWVWAFDHPYFAVTDGGGRFDIPDVPAGAWRVAAWHETGGYRGGPLGERVTVRDDGEGTHLLGPVVFDVTGR